MESKIHIFWGKGESDKASPKFNSYFLLLFFQGSEEAGQEVSDVAAVVPVGGKVKSAKGRLSRLGDNLSSKGERWIGRAGFSNFNYALLGKWRWNVFHHQEELWAKVLDSKYVSWRSLDESRRNSRDSIWWQDLSIVCNSSEEGSW